MSRVMLIDRNDADDPLAASLSASGHNVLSIDRHATALRAAEEFLPDVIILNLALTCHQDPFVMATLRMRSATAAVVLISPEWTEELAAKTLVTVAELASGRTGVHSSPFDATLLLPPEPHALVRLADRSVRFVGCTRDASTLRAFGHAVGISPGGLRNWCRTARIRPRSYLLFARALRAVCRRKQAVSRWAENLLDFVDQRTFSKFFVMSGGSCKGLPESVDLLLSRQKFISHPEWSRVVRDALRESTTNE